MTDKEFKIVFRDGEYDKVVNGTIDDSDPDFIKVNAYDGIIFINKKHVIFMREKWEHANYTFSFYWSRY